MKLKNIGNIDFDNEAIERPTEKGSTLNKYTPNNVWHLRSDIIATPVDFRQEVLNNLWGSNFIDRCEKVLEIGFGCGRNAQFFMNETQHVKYYGFDTSTVGLKYFLAQQFPEDRHYVSCDIDEEILSQKYDLIFSTYVLQHIGFSNNLEIYDSNRMTQILWALLKDGGYWMSHEGRTGDNGWNCDKWLNDNFKNINTNILFRYPYELKGSSSGMAHSLYIIKK